MLGHSVLVMVEGYSFWIIDYSIARQSGSPAEVGFIIVYANFRVKEPDMLKHFSFNEVSPAIYVGSFLKPVVLP